MDSKLSLPTRLLERFPLLARVAGEAWVVGGAVRDLIMGITPFEVDLSARSARDVAAAFAEATRSRLVDMGRERFTTFRVVTGDSEYDFSEIEGSFEDDIRRRDCTMNAVAISLQTKEVVDLVGGVEDARARIIRMIRGQNYVDDPLRILKLVRLAVTRDCSIEPETFAALSRHAGAVRNVAVERVHAELQKMLDDSRAHRGVEILGQLGLDLYLFGRAISETSLQRVKTLLEGDFVTRFAAVTWELDVDARRALTDQFKWSDLAVRELNALINTTRRLLEKSEDDVVLHEAGRTTAQRAILLLGAIGDHGASMRAATLLRGRPDLFDVKPLLSGLEIQKFASIGAGPEIGRLKRALLIAQLHGEVRSREEAIEFVKGQRSDGFQP
jgi:tRNA nucleotidyltransferase/poly(A) polymerase